jgi:hypothetical protein
MGKEVAVASFKDKSLKDGGRFLQNDIYQKHTASQPSPREDNIKMDLKE